MFKKWWGKRAARVQWDAGLAWFRLRYLEPAGLTRSIRLLSRPQACSRVALYYRPGEAVSELYLGIPDTHVRLLQRMAADFGYLLKPKPSDVAIPAAQRLTAVTELPWERPFLAHVVNEVIFVSLVDGARKGSASCGRGSYMPRPPTRVPQKETVTWQLPSNPTPGLTARPYWNGQPPPAHLVAIEPDPGRWLLGRSQSGTPLYVSGRVNIYGRQDAAADWLVHQVTQMLSLDHTNLVVIDGAGDLVPRLKRKTAVTRLLGEQLAYVDIDSASLTGGFNPLAAVPGETAAATVQRWQCWFRGMNVHPQGIQLLVRAQQDGVEDLSGLRKWLKQVERQGHYAAVSSLGMALNRLTASRVLREWLEWPTNRFDILPQGALFFACKGSGWDRRQLLQAVLLGAIQVPDVRLVVHGFPWSAEIGFRTPLPSQAVVSNGPYLMDAQPLLVYCSAASARVLSERFLDGDPMQMEMIQLLRHGEGVIFTSNGPVMTSWLVPDLENSRRNC